MAAKVVREGNSVTITGLESEVWGNDSPRQMSVIAAMDAALRAAGEDVSYDYLMGVSGGAFRVQFSWCPSAACAPCGFDCCKAATDAMGYQVRSFFTRDPQDDRLMEDNIAQARLALVATLDRGVPALAGSEECGLIVGYMDGGDRFLQRPYSPQAPGYPPMKGWPWGVDILEKQAVAPARAEAIRKSLETAVELWRTPKQGDYWCGQAAYENWAADLRNDDRFTTMTKDNWFGMALGNGYTYGSLWNARQCAAAYLRMVAPEMPAPMRAHLLRAAERYDALTQRMGEGFEGAACPWSLMPWILKDPANWTRPVREAQAARLLKIRDLEAQAVEEIEAALRAG